MEKERISKPAGHILTLDNNRKAIVTGVVEVISSTDKAIVARTETSTFQLSGDALRVSKLIPEEKLCEIDGNIQKLEYRVKTNTKSLLKRIFK